MRPLKEPWEPSGHVEDEAATDEDSCQSVEVDEEYGFGISRTEGAHRV